MVEYVGPSGDTTGQPTVEPPVPPQSDSDVRAKSRLRISPEKPCSDKDWVKAYANLWLREFSPRGLAYTINIFVFIYYSF